MKIPKKQKPRTTVWSRHITSIPQNQHLVVEKMSHRATDYAKLESVFGRILWIVLIPLVRIAIHNQALVIISPEGREVQLGDPGHCSLVVKLRTYSTLLRIVLHPRMALGEEFVKGNWTLEKGSLTELLSLLLRASNQTQGSFIGKSTFWIKRQFFLLGQNYGKAKSRRHVKAHYDQGDEIFLAFLDKNLVYTCADFEGNALDLDQAQIDKVFNTLNRIELEPEHSLLEIGSGWGCASRTAAIEYGSKVVGLTLSENQLTHSIRKSEESGIAQDLTYELTDYREHEKDKSDIYDRVLSIGMVEHVGYHQLNRYFLEVSRLLKPGGVTLAHTITRSQPGITNPWIDKYIFPGGYIATNKEIIQAAENAGLKIFKSPYQYKPENYIKTLRMWNEKLNENWKSLKKIGYSDQIKLIYEFYFAGSEAAFQEMDMRATQFVFKKNDET